MPWGVLAGAVLLVYLLQTAVVGLLGWSWLDLFLMLTLLVALLAPLHDARIAGWLIGFAQDLGSTDAVGIHAFTLGLACLLLTSIRGILNLRVWWSRLLVVFLCAWPAPFLYALHLRFWAGADTVGASDIILGSAAHALLAAAIATVLTAWPTLRFRRRRAGGYGANA